MMNELQWVDFLQKKIKAGKGVITGIGDDCAVVKIGQERRLLKSDLFVEDKHFRRQDLDFKTIGMRAVARVLSDFAACAGTPEFIGASVGIPRDVKDDDLKQLLDGILGFRRKYKYSLVGGDTVRSPKLFLDIWAIGTADPCILRSTALEGDHIFVTGRLGARPFDKPFEPRIKEAAYLVKNFKVNSMIDISDGFILDLYRVIKASRKGALLEWDHLPLTKGESDLSRGEDYELIFTIDKTDPGIDQLKKKFHWVGRITKKGYFMNKLGAAIKVDVKGYTHF